MKMTIAQYELMLKAEDACISCFAHQPELMFDVMPLAEPLAEMQIEWYLKSKTVYHD